MNIDPKNMTNFSRTNAELQSFWLFSLFVAVKNSDYAAGRLARLLHKARLNEQNPFDYLRELGETGIHNALVAAKARFFLLHSRPQCECAVLDTHILAWMRSKGIDAPAATPTGEKYLFLERVFLNLAQSEFPLMSIAQIDLLIWMKQSNRLEDDFQNSF